MTIGHTPAKWELFAPTSENGRYGIDGRNENGKAISIIWYSDGGDACGIYGETRAQAAANAKLIAAAPELLEACVDMVQQIEIADHLGDVDWDKIKTAINKAKGE